ncbi:type I-F CRISPR-associated endonuclease Cas1f [Vibrio splendidus]|nr:type I-F CRISPR-associated endonuclease Cas1f [Vibrio splendidus]MCC4880745.1 type I-F CRISPR-associated endonuclease Cas1f [Vibrio splendidus]
MSIITTLKNSVYYVEHCKIVSNDARLSFIKAENSFNKAFSLPHLNLAVLLLGPGTSITQQAAKLLSEEGVNIGFTGGGGSPLFLASNSEYRPTEYLQQWISWWQFDDRRLMVAKAFQRKRISLVAEYWKKFFGAELEMLCVKPIATYAEKIPLASNVNELLGYEANFTKSLYKILANHFKVKDFKREPRDHTIYANKLLDAGNYIAYGFASSALWTLGIPPSLAVIHGKTRRGALVFDVADMYKDALVLPLAFYAASEQFDESYYRKMLIDHFDRSNAFKNSFSVLKHAASFELDKI